MPLTFYSHSQHICPIVAVVYAPFSPIILSLRTYPTDTNLRPHTASRYSCSPARRQEHQSIFTVYTQILGLEAEKHVVKIHEEVNKQFDKYLDLLFSATPTKLC